MSRRVLGLVAILVVAAAIVGLGVRNWRHRQIYPATDNAYLQGDVTLVASRVPGSILTTRYRENDWVEAGTVLARLDPRDFEQALNAARASLTKAEASLVRRDAQIARAEAELDAARADARLKNADLERFQNLEERGSTARRQYDQARAASEVAAAQVLAAEKALVAVRAGRSVDEREIERARAAVAEAELRLSYCTIVAPTSGVLAEKNAQVGAVVAAGQPLFRIAHLQNGAVWIEANFKETQLSRIRVGQPVEFTVDVDGERSFEGRVESIGAGSGSVFSLLPPENATGNWVKVVQRVPVRIAFDLDALPENSRRLGLSVRVTIDTRDGAAER